ncbi:MAG: hypothetical protein Q4G21_08160 [Dermabacter sp.]|nr:hypothetical protein [Dermabacter sp.]
MAQFRRPASLSPQKQDEIEGGIDPARRDEAAHESAAALLHATRQSVRPEVVERVVRLAEHEGLDDLAALWSGAEPSSLPGALWRLYVLHAWVHGDPSQVKQRFELGRSTAPGLTYLAGFPEPPDIDSMRDTLDEILRGAFTGDLSIALKRASAIAMLVAYGTAHAADSSSSIAELSAHEDVPLTPQALTDSAHRLLAMGEALDAASRSALLGTLD